MTRHGITVSRCHDTSGHVMTRHGVTPVGPPLRSNPTHTSNPNPTRTLHPGTAFAPQRHQYRDLPPDAQLVVVVMAVAEGRGEVLVGSSVMPLFSKRGRLKTGPQRLRVWEGVPPCTAFPSSTPGKVGGLDRGQGFGGLGWVSVGGRGVQRAQRPLEVQTYCFHFLRCKLTVFYFHRTR